jgi:hypothetical protein
LNKKAASLPVILHVPLPRAYIMYDPGLFGIENEHALAIGQPCASTLSLHIREAWVILVDNPLILFAFQMILLSEKCL